ncbi:hemolysin [Vibrio tubiashii]|uniref:putative hemolysin n=1 Tax=Vibrio sp. M260118 TaxID=3020896 RepID=UPI0005371718|nr:hemolysin [Vibrio tubiashii]
MKKTCFALAVSVGVLAGCTTEPNSTEKQHVSMANPAAVYCVQQGGELDTVTENEQRVTYCVLPNGDRVEQWDYYRQNHKQQ